MLFLDRSHTLSCDFWVHRAGSQLKTGPRPTHLGQHVGKVVVSVDRDVVLQNIDGVLGLEVGRRALAGRDDDVGDPEQKIGDAQQLLFYSFCC